MNVLIGSLPRMFTLFSLVILKFLSLETEPKDNENQISLYVRRWRPSQYTFNEIQELILSEEATVAELKAKVINLSLFPEHFFVV